MDLDRTTVGILRRAIGVMHFFLFRGVVGVAFERDGGGWRGGTWEEVDLSHISSKDSQNETRELSLIETSTSRLPVSRTY